jgi:hypothetical protein
VLQDNNKHKTAILFIVYYIIPFVDVCVTRITGKNKDLKRDPKIISNNLAKVFLQQIIIMYLIVNITVVGYFLGC